MSLFVDTDVVSRQQESSAVSGGGFREQRNCRLPERSAIAGSLPATRSAGEPHADSDPVATGKIAGEGLPAMELSDQPHYVKSKAEVRAAVDAGARLPQRFE